MREKVHYDTTSSLSPGSSRAIGRFGKFGFLEAFDPFAWVSPAPILLGKVQRNEWMREPRMPTRVFH
jgi:hypothetical protein